MGLVHFLADSLEVPLVESVADSQYAVFFLDDVFGAEIVFGGDVTADSVKFIHIGVAEGLYAQRLCYALAALTALVIGGVDQGVFYFRVEKHQLVTVGLEGEIFEFHGAAVETHQVVFLTEDGGELVHYAAVYAAVVMFGGLTDTGKLELVDGVAVEHIVHGEREAAFESGRGGKTGSEGHIACEDGVEALDFTATLDDFAADSEDIAGPLLGGSILFAETEFGVFVDVDGEDADGIGAVGGDFGHDYFIDGAGEHEAAVIVGVFADKVDTSGGGIESAFLAEFLLEDGADFFLHDILIGKKG